MFAMKQSSSNPYFVCDLNFTLRRNWIHTITFYYMITK
jgi:hypothetical protein